MNVTELRKELCCSHSDDRDGNPAFLPLPAPVVASPSAPPLEPSASSNGYENAPATRMLATNCACCSRALVDAASVEAGMGPVCRKRVRYHEIDESVRKEANKLIHDIAVIRKGPGIVPLLNRLRELGLDAVAKKIEKRCVSVVVEERDNVLYIKTPFKESAIAMWRRIRGRRWNKEEKVNTVPVSERTKVWALLIACYKGELLSSSKGIFEI